jgi:hypothetical protein
LATLKVTYKLLTIWDRMPRYFVWNPALRVYQVAKPEKLEEFATEKAVEM